MPAFPVGLFGSLLGQSPKYPARLLPRVGDRQGEVARLVFGVQLVAGGGRNEAGRSFLANPARPQPLGSLLDELVLQEALGKQSAYHVLLKVPAKARYLREDDVPMRERLVGVKQGLLAHGREAGESRLWKEAHHLLY